MNVKIPNINPSTNAFAVFSMLLIGVFAAASIVLFDYWAGGEGRSISIVVLNKLQQHDIPKAWLAAISGLTLMSLGFFFYNLSFLLIAVPAFSLKKYIESRSLRRKSVFQIVSEKEILERSRAEDGLSQDVRFRDIFMYLLLANADGRTAGAIRFNFTQLMYARSIGMIMIWFSAYASWSLGDGLLISLIFVFLSWLAVVLFYLIGLYFFDNVMAAGVLIVKNAKI